MKNQLGFNQLPVHPRYGIRAISYSDLIAIENNVERWFQHRKMESDAMAFGTTVHALIKHRKLKGVPHGNNPEKRLSSEIYFGKKEHFTVVGTPDDFDNETLYEYKSAKKLWNAKKSKEHEQFPCYAFLIKENMGILLKKGKLISLETTYDEQSEGIALTGKMQVIDTEITMLDIMKIKARFVNAYKKVISYQALCQQEFIKESQ